MLESILTTTSTGTISFASALICIVSALVLGIIAAYFYMFRNVVNKSFVIALALLPAMVQIVILLVNGNLGAGVAVMGAFSLVRFRSVPGSAREITSIFLAMAIGLGCGMGYIALSAVFTIFIGAMQILLTLTSFGKTNTTLRELRIAIPENLDYDGLFNDLFDKYTLNNELNRVKTIGMGSSYELSYSVTLKDKTKEKQFLDDIRVRNGNLTVSCGKVSTVREEL